MKNKIITDNMLYEHGWVFQYNYEEIPQENIKKLQDFLQDENARLFVSKEFLEGKSKFTEVLITYYQENINSGVILNFDAENSNLEELINDIINWKYEAAGCSEAFEIE